MKDKIKAVLLDFDGVLFRSDEAAHKTCCNIFADCGLDQPSFEDWINNCHSPYIDYYTTRGVSMPERDIAKAYEVYEQKHSVSMGFYEDSCAIVERLKRMGLKLAIVSFRDEQSIVSKCDAEGISQSFEMITGGHKCKVRPIAAFGTMMGLRPNEMVFVGDLPPDIRDGRDAGVHTVGLTRSRNTDAMLTKAGANHVVATLYDFIELVEEANKDPQ